MRIIDVEFRTGLDRATIRYYEKEGMIAPVRHENGYREYSDADVQNLTKIKLLRMLGMSLSTIRELQQGNADFQVALTEQIHLLEKKRDNTQRSIQICGQIKTDGVNYSQLDADRYLSTYQKIELRYPGEIASSKSLTDDFQESVPREYHPFRHLLARLLDYEILSIFILFIQVVFLRTRSETFVLPYIVALPLWIPFEARCYVFFRTTPGKWAFGIQVDNADGTRHSLRSAFRRAFEVYRYGMGWGLPGWSIWRLIRSCILYGRGDENEWNYDSEITYHSFLSLRDFAKPIIVFGVLIALAFGTISIANMPKYSSNSLTIEQFATNYNEYHGGGNPYTVMNHDGTFVNKDTDPGSVTVIIGGRSNDHYANLEYIMEGESLRGFTCKETVSFQSMYVAFESHYMTAIKALLAAQPGENTASANRFVNNMMDAVDTALRSGTNSITYQNEQMIVRWSIEYDDSYKHVTSAAGSMIFTPEGIPTGTAEIQIYVELK